MNGYYKVKNMSYVFKTPHVSHISPKKKEKIIIEDIKKVYKKYDSVEVMIPDKIVYGFEEKEETTQ